MPSSDGTVALATSIISKVRKKGGGGESKKEKERVWWFGSGGEEGSYRLYRSFFRVDTHSILQLDAATAQYIDAAKIE